VALNQQHRHILAIRSRHGNCQGIACSHFGLLLCNAFQILGPDIAAIDDDLIGFTAGDDNVFIDQIMDKSPGTAIKTQIQTGGIASLYPLIE